MKQNKTIRIIATLFTLAVLLIVSCGPVRAVEQENVLQKSEMPIQGYELIAQNGNLKLYLNRENTWFYVENIKDGSAWFSNPPDYQNDSVAAGITMSEMQSLFSAVYYSKGVDNGAVQDRINSFASGVLNDDATIEDFDNGFEVTYILDEEILTLPIRVELTDEGLSVTMRCSKMKIGEAYSIESISLLPYFGAAAKTDNGYFLVPDGCGGLINFGDAKKNSGTFSKRIYGDCVTSTQGRIDDPNDDTKATVPVYGICKNGSGMFAVIEQGAALAQIDSETSGINSSYATVYPTFNLYSNMEYSLSSSSTVIFEKKDKKLADCKISYFFLSGEDANYNGMANSYRSKLLKEGVLTENKTNEATPYFSVWGGIVAKRSYFGFLIDTVIPMTTTEQLVLMIDEAKKQGLTTPTVNYLNWNKQELSGQPVSNMKASSKLVKGEYSIKKLLNNKNFTFYPAVNRMLSYTKIDLISSFTHPVADISGITVFKKKISPTIMDEYGKRNFFLNKKYCERYLTSFEKSLSKGKYDKISLSDVSGMLYEDFRDETIKRSDFEALYVGKLNEVAKGRKVMLDNPNAYAFGAVKEIVNLPTKTDKQLIIDTEVPFVQIVLNGCVSYATEVLNYVDDTTALLKTLETGSMPHYFMYYGKESELKSTDYSELCGGNYQRVLAKAAKVYKEVKSVKDITKDAVLKEHQVLDANVRVGVYENGIAVYVNYGESDYILKNGNTVPAGGYFVGREEH